MMIYDRAFRIRDVTDGTSNTLMVAENSAFPVWADGQWINGLNIFDQKYAINYHSVRSEALGGRNSQRPSRRGQRRVVRRLGPVPQRNDGFENLRPFLPAREEKL